MTSTIDPPCHLSQVLAVPTFRTTRSLSSSHPSSTRPLGSVILDPHHEDLAFMSPAMITRRFPPRSPSLSTSSRKTSKEARSRLGEKYVETILTLPQSIATIPSLAPTNLGVGVPTLGAHTMAAKPLVSRNHRGWLGTL